MTHSGKIWVRMTDEGWTYYIAMCKATRKVGQRDPGKRNQQEHRGTILYTGDQLYNYPG